MRWILIFLCIAQGCALSAKSVSIQVQERRDYEVLDLFFNMGILEEEYGYVLEGVKPISARQFYALDAIPITKDLHYAEDEFKHTVLVREAIKVWNRLCSQQDRFALKAIPVIENEADVCGYEVEFIHILKLKEVVRENISLFRYVLGPAVEVDELVHRLCFSNERFSDVLQDDLTLTGIVLGFGTHNSVVGGRLETIDRMAISKDSAPFLPKSSLLQGEGSQFRFGLSYLENAGGSDFFFRRATSPARPSFGFSTMQGEILALESKKELLPTTLHEQPRFIFAAFKEGDSNRSLFNALQRAQTRSKSILSTDRRLDKVLEIIGGKKPRIFCDRSPVQRSVWSFVDNLSTQWSCILKGVAHRFTEAQDQQRFRQALTGPLSSPIPPPIMGASREMLRGLQQARDNLAAAQSQCVVLSKDQSVKAVIPGQLYIKTLQQGAGENIRDINRLRLKYVIEDHFGDILFAHHDAWINLSDTIPGFVHGLQGMRIGEKRTLFIHPVLGYGPLTTLPPCALLVAHVQLLDLDSAAKFTLPPVTPLEFDWVHDQRLDDALQESLVLLPSYIGAFYRRLLSQVESENPSLQLDFPLR